MLDDNESSESSTSTSTRRRAAGRPAGPPAALDTDIFAPPAETKAAPPAKKAPAASDKGDADAGEPPAKKAAAKKAAAKKAPAKKKAAKPAEKAEPDTSGKSDDAPKGSVMFQPPETTTLPARPKQESSDDREDDG